MCAGVCSLRFYVVTTEQCWKNVFDGDDRAIAARFNLPAGVDAATALPENPAIRQIPAAIAKAFHAYGNAR